MRRITLPDFAKALETVFPPATYAKVFQWAKSGYLPTLRDPSVKQSHHYVDTRFIVDFLRKLGLVQKEVDVVLITLNIKY